MADSTGIAAPPPAAAHWMPPQASREAIENLRGALQLERPAAAVLVERGYGDTAAAREFLYPRLDGLHDPLLMRDMDRAVARILHAVRSRERILLYGDYDVDGTCSIVILKKAIEMLGGDADFHIPHRLKDGYGMRSEAVERAALDGIRLIVSADTGIRAADAVRQANALGIDVIVTDHHLPQAELPPALAVLNPNRADCAYPNKHLCGAGVVFKLLQALLAAGGIPETRRLALLESFLKPVAIATVADIVPLTGENRIFVQRGISGLRNVRSEGLKSLLAVAGFEDGECPSAHEIAFRLAPRINAAGRMATARDVIELLLTGDAGRARALAAQLDALNRERQEAEARIVAAILKECEESPRADAAPAFVFARPDWHLGVLGIVAGRLAERFYRPVFVLSEAVSETGGEPMLSGSGRGIPSFHILAALESMPELFTRFGGHRQAAGVTLPAARLAEFRRRFEQCASLRLTPHDLCRRHAIDADISFADLSERAIQQIMLLGPFGCGNPAPLFHAQAAEVAGPPKALKDGKHFNVPLRHNGRLLFSKAWNFSDRAALLVPGVKLDILFQVEDDAYARKRGGGAWRISLKDVRPS
ncbi:MAG: single-stranded-DNA-specific exonuclease RecJ [Bryobacteraceae bacterium]